MNATDAVAKVRCMTLPECPKEFFVPAWAVPRCPVCGSNLHPESNNRTAGPMLYHPETHENLWALNKVEKPEVANAS